jgi:uncharacterized 2Fe-2S/4Fe-4S cluster protein (DUF4445 family)
MLTLHINLNFFHEKLEFSSGKSLKQLLDMTWLRVRSGCRGIGACGLCKIRISSGIIPPPTQAEEMHLDQNEIARGVRLACQQFPTESLSIDVVSPAPMSQWHSDTVGDYSCKYSLDQQRGYFLAIDVGTTNLGISIIDNNGVLVADRKTLNPQMYMGADVLSRIIGATSSKENAELLWEMLVETISDGIGDIQKREGISHLKIKSCEVVGNTAMLALLCRHNYHLLLEPAYWMLPVDTSIITPPIN